VTRNVVVEWYGMRCGAVEYEKWIMKLCYE